MKRAVGSFPYEYLFRDVTHMVRYMGGRDPAGTVHPCVFEYNATILQLSCKVQLC